ncbi:MAG: DUF169 domain-containing protein [bacterium]
MKAIRVGYTPVGVKIAPEPLENYPEAEEYRGISYCDAVRLASEGAGRALLLTPESIGVCPWSPVVLGFKPPDPKYDLKVEFNLPLPIASVLLAPVDFFSAGSPPDVVVVRTTKGEMKKIVEALGWENMATEMAGRLDRTALPIFIGDGSPLEKKRVQQINRALAKLNRSRRWRDFTKGVFKNKMATYLFDQLLDSYLANMSICRNSTVIPHLTGKANISYFCTGGIAWGLNRPEHMTCGMPFELYGRLKWNW